MDSWTKGINGLLGMAHIEDTKENGPTPTL